MYFQMQTHLCTPSRETVSTTYSSPARNSISSTSRLVRPRTLTVPCSAVKVSRTCSSDLHTVTPSEPAPSHGLTTAMKEPVMCSTSRSATRNLSTSSREVASFCAATGRPALRAAIDWRNLLRRVSDMLGAPAPRSFSASLSSSASSTPGSEPQKTSRGSAILRMAAHVALIPPASWITTPAYSTPCLEWPRSSAGHASLHTQMMRSPWWCWAW
mmetsp:Transcript_34867/g.83231  ORF Transcript_34867/g.83231 Transcript_34867/m.83231 type:complete len:214 (+) Transcript_34867:1090-1731(+)